MSETRVRVEAPLPLDVAGSILRAIGTLYPNTQLDTTADAKYSLTLIIPDSDRPAADTTDLNGVGADRRGGEEGSEAQFLAFTENGMDTTTPADLSLLLGNIAANMLADETIANYVEAQVRDEDGNQHIVIFARSGTQTPHTLRQAADAKVEKLTRLLDQSAAALNVALAYARGDLDRDERTRIEELDGCQQALEILQDAIETPADPTDTTPTEGS